MSTYAVHLCRNACQLCNTMTLFLADGLAPHLREEMKRRYIKDLIRAAGLGNTKILGPYPSMGA